MTKTYDNGMIFCKNKDEDFDADFKMANENSKFINWKKERKKIYY